MEWKNYLLEQKYTGTGKYAENVVQHCLESCGFEKRDFKELVKCYPEYKQKSLAEAIYFGNIDLESGKYYFEQPIGSQGSPDFIVVDTIDGFTLIEFVEVKASSKNLFEFNSHLVMPGFTYVFSNPQVGFRIKLGNEIMDPAVRQVLAETKEAMDNVVAEQNKKLKGLNNPQNWRYYPRGKINNSDIFVT